MNKAKLTVFIIDNDPDIIGLLTSLLEQAGHTVISNQESSSAVSSIKTIKPDCVVIDLMMPGIDGLELCKELRSDADTALTKVIVISGKAYDFDRKRAFEFGADAYITKPINAKKFVPQLERVVQDRIELRFWGVRGTLPVSGEDVVRYGGETNCTTLEFAKGQFLIFDAGSGASKRCPITLWRNVKGALRLKFSSPTRIGTISTPCPFSYRSTSKAMSSKCWVHPMATLRCAS